MNFDWNYLFTRAQTLEIKEFNYFSRIKDQETRIKDAQFQSRQMYFKKTKDVNMTGRIQIDMLNIITQDFKLNQYNLNFVSQHFLGEQKEDVHWSVIHELQEGNQYTRKRLAQYCLKDSDLVMQLLDRLKVIYMYAEMARVTGTPMNYLINRGQQIKILSLLYRKANKEGFIIPTIPQEKQFGDKYEGAHILEPYKGFYTNCIAVLDFASLYPSIMIVHNLCYTTLIANQQALQMQQDQYEVTPIGHNFVKKSVREGILPKILQELLSARNKAKEELKKVKNPFDYKILDGRQLALKVCANSVYGFTGCHMGALPCIEISSSVTAYGRSMIEFSKNEIEMEFQAIKGYNQVAKVLYGDTDSLMIDFGTKNVAETIQLANQAADLITLKFSPPVKLQFEKIYFPFLLVSVKKYAGLI